MTMAQPVPQSEPANAETDKEEPKSARGRVAAIRAEIARRRAARNAKPASNSAIPHDDMPPEAPPKAADLSALPGIGPGVISMLQSAGIRSLTDMAMADPTELCDKLGLVGELLDLAHWIETAAEMSEQADR